MSTDICDYRLVLDNEVQPPKYLRIATDFWHCEGLYLSSVCMVVHLKPTAKTLRHLASQGLDDAKDDLRTLLRGLGQRLLESNLWRPLVAVLEAEDTRFDKLAAEQDWHRGDFLLFIERPECEGPNSLRSRIADLLEPGDQLPIFRLETSEPHKPEWFRRKLDEAAASKAMEDAVRPFLDLVLPPPASGRAWENAPEEDIRRGFDAWTARIKDDADHIAQGGKPR